MRSLITTPTSTLYLDHVFDDATENSCSGVGVDQIRSGLHAVPVRYGCFGLLLLLPAPFDTIAAIRLPAPGTDERNLVGLFEYRGPGSGGAALGLALAVTVS